MVVADFGAGAGDITFTCAELVGESGRVFAVDIQKELTAKIRNEAQRRDLDCVEVVWGDVEAQNGSTLSAESVDVVLLANLLFQVKDAAAVLKEAKRVLKPAGRLAVVDWSESFGHLGPRPDDIIDESEAKKLCEESGFEITGEINAGAHHYGFLARLR